MKHSAAAPSHPPSTSGSPKVPAEAPTTDGSPPPWAESEKARVDQQRSEGDGPIGPLWVITIAMGAFFGIAALVFMLDR